MLWVPGSVAALVVFIALIGFREKARRRLVNPGQANGELQHISPSPALSRPEQMVTREALQLVFDQLATAVQRGDANLLLPLRDALIGLVSFGDSIATTIWPENTLVTFKSRVDVFIVVAAPTTSNYAAADALLNYYRSLSEVIDQIWKTLNAAPTPQYTQNHKHMLEALTEMLGVFEFDDQVDAEKRFSIVCQRLYSGNGIITDEIRSMTTINNNSNTNYSFNGGHIYNYNPVNNFVFSRSITEQRDEAMSKIMAVLGMQIARGAVHYAQPSSAGCLEHTRESVMSRLMSWVMDGQTKIFWLVGMAGTGKTAIAVTVCRMLQNDPSVILGGTFFFSRSASSTERTKVRCVVPTLAASLAAHAPDFATKLTGELENSVHMMAQYPAAVQIAAFLQKPLTALSSSSRPIVFVIDALDECDDEEELDELLRSIADFESAANVKFILLSRPEMHIRGTPISSHDHNTILELHEINDKEVSEDIRRYITSTLHNKAPGSSWYTYNDIQTLVKLSEGLFIFASTVLKYVLDRVEVEGRKDRLRRASSAASGSTAQMSPLHKIYEMVVREAWRPDKSDEEELEDTRRVIACILAARTPLSVEALADLLDLSFGTLRGALERLHSVVYVPAVNSAGLRALHASFGDYMLQKATDDVRITASHGDEQLARGCLHVMDKNLRFRPADSVNPHQPNDVNHWDNISLSIEYACRQWIHHVTRLQNRSAFDNEIETISGLQQMFWLEVVSLSPSIGPAAALLLGGPV